MSEQGESASAINDGVPQESISGSMWRDMHDKVRKRQESIEPRVGKRRARSETLSITRAQFLTAFRYLWSHLEKEGWDAKQENGGMVYTAPGEETPYTELSAIHKVRLEFPELLESAVRSAKEDPDWNKDFVEEITKEELASPRRVAEAAPSGKNGKKSPDIEIEPIVFHDLFQWLRDFKNWKAKPGKGSTKTFYLQSGVRMYNGKPAGIYTRDFFKAPEEVVSYVLNRRELKLEYQKYRHAVRKGEVEVEEKSRKPPKKNEKKTDAPSSTLTSTSSSTSASILKSSERDKKDSNEEEEEEGEEGEGEGEGEGEEDEDEDEEEEVEFIAVVPSKARKRLRASASETKNEDLHVGLKRIKVEKLKSDPFEPPPSAKRVGKPPKQSCWRHATPEEELVMALAGEKESVQTADEEEDEEWSDGMARKLEEEEEEEERSDQDVLDEEDELLVEARQKRKTLQSKKRKKVPTPDFIDDDAEMNEVEDMDDEKARQNKSAKRSGGSKTSNRMPRQQKQSFTRKSRRVKPTKRLSGNITIDESRANEGAKKLVLKGLSAMDADIESSNNEDEIQSDAEVAAINTGSEDFGICGKRIGDEEEEEMESPTTLMLRQKLRAIPFEKRRPIVQTNDGDRMVPVSVAEMERRLFTSHLFILMPGVPDQVRVDVLRCGGRVVEKREWTYDTLISVPEAEKMMEHDAWFVSYPLEQNSMVRMCVLACGIRMFHPEFVYKCIEDMDIPDNYQPFEIPSGPSILKGGLSVFSECLEERPRSFRILHRRLFAGRGFLVVPSHRSTQLESLIVLGGGTVVHSAHAVGNEGFIIVDPDGTSVPAGKELLREMAKVGINKTWKFTTFDFIFQSLIHGRILTKEEVQHEAFRPSKSTLNPLENKTLSNTSDAVARALDSVNESDLFLAKELAEEQQEEEEYKEFRRKWREKYIKRLAREAAESQPDATAAAKEISDAEKQGLTAQKTGKDESSTLFSAFQSWPNSSVMKEPSSSSSSTSNANQHRQQEEAKEKRKKDIIDEEDKRDALEADDDEEFDENEPNKKKTSNNVIQEGFERIIKKDLARMEKRQRQLERQERQRLAEIQKKRKFTETENPVKDEKVKLEKTVALTENKDEKKTKKVKGQLCITKVYHENIMYLPSGDQAADKTFKFIRFKHSRIGLGSLIYLERLDGFKGFPSRVAKLLKIKIIGKEAWINVRMCRLKIRTRNDLWDVVPVDEYAETKLKHVIGSVPAIRAIEADRLIFDCNPHPIDYAPRPKMHFHFNNIVFIVTDH